MRLLHTSDWHLGRTLHGVDLLEHQAAYLDHLNALAADLRPDVILVSGDIYDRAVPPVAAVQLLSESLDRLSEHCPVVLTSGNHDSAARLGFASTLLRDGVHIRTSVAHLAEPIEFHDDHGPVLVYALPFLDPEGARRDLTVASGVAPGRSHEGVLGAAMARVKADLETRGTTLFDDGPRVVVMAHAFVVGGEGSDSERDIRVGGVDAAPMSVFRGVDYLALGHLHGPQRLSLDGGEARYSGSPLAYSFSERYQRKSTALVELGEPGKVSVELLDAPVPRRLTELVGSIDEVLSASSDPFSQDWVRVVVTDAHRPPDLYARVKERFPNVLVTQHRPEGASSSEQVRRVASDHDPLEVSSDFVAELTGTEPDLAERAVLSLAYEAALAQGNEG